MSNRLYPDFRKERFVDRLRAGEQQHRQRRDRHPKLLQQYEAEDRDEVVFGKEPGNLPSPG